MKNAKKTISLLLSLFLIIQIVVVGSFNAGAATENYKTWKQYDSRWADVEFGDEGDTLARAGCAITSIAMLLVHSGAVNLSKTSFNPGIFCKTLVKNDAFTTQGWIYWYKVDTYISTFEYKDAVDISGSKSSKASVIADYIKQGYVVVVMVNNGGHYVAVNYVSGSNVVIMDPGRDNTDLFYYNNDGITKLRLFKGPTNGIKSSASTSKVSSTTSSKASSASTKTYITGKYTITSDNGVNLRSGAGTNYGLLDYGIPYNESVTVTKINKNWGYTTYSSLSGWFCLDYSKYKSPLLTKIVVSPPTRTRYLVGDTFSSSGMSVVATYSDKTTAKVKDFTIDKVSTKKAATLTVNINYQNKTGSFKVIVVDHIDKGDVNFDGNINVDDALLILQYSVNKIDKNDFYIKYADTSNNKLINVEDALLILQYSTKIIKAF